MVKSETENLDLRHFRDIESAIGIENGPNNSYARFIERAYVSYPFWSRRLKDSQSHRFDLLTRIRVHGLFHYGHEGLQFLIEAHGDFYCAGIRQVIQSTVPLLPAHEALITMLINGTVVAELPSDVKTAMAVMEPNEHEDDVEISEVEVPSVFRIVRVRMDYTRSGPVGHAADLILQLRGDKNFARVFVQDCGKWLRSQGHLK